MGGAVTPVEGETDTGILDREGSDIFVAKNFSSLSGSHPISTEADSRLRLKADFLCAP